MIRENDRGMIREVIREDMIGRIRENDMIGSGD